MKRSVKLSTLMIGLALVGLATALALPKLQEHQRRRNAASAMEALKEITNAQTLYREGDRDGNGILDYAPDLESLVKAGDLSPELADGEHAGYRFSIRHHTQDQFLWSANADPLALGVTGDAYFGANMMGVLFYDREEPIAFSLMDGSSEAASMCNCGDH